MTEFPKLTWLNINGEQVPFTEPQHFTGNGDETVRTGKNNPLPVENFQKKNGIYLPVDEENPMHTQNEDVETRLQNIEDKLDSVIENGSVNTQLTGSVIELINDTITVSAGSYIEVFNGVRTSEVVYLTGGARSLKLGSSEFDVRFSEYLDGTFNPQYQRDDNDNFRIVFKDFYPKTMTIVVRLYNNSNEEDDYRIVIIGVGK